MSLQRAFDLLLEIQISPEWDNIPETVTDRLEEVMEIIEKENK